MAKAMSTTTATASKEPKASTKQTGDLPRIQKILNSPPESSDQREFASSNQQEDADRAIALLQHFSSQPVVDLRPATALGGQNKSPVMNNPIKTTVPQYQTVINQPTGHAVAHPGAQPMVLGILPQMAPQVAPQVAPQIARFTASQIPQYSYSAPVPDKLRDIRDASFHIYSLCCAQTPSPDLILGFINNLIQIRKDLFGSPELPYGVPTAPVYPAAVYSPHPGYRAQSTPAWGSVVNQVQEPEKTSRRKRSRGKDVVQCHECGTQETPEWRRGPEGARTLCNACGLYHAKIAKKQGDEQATQKLRERRQRNRS